MMLKFVGYASVEKLLGQVPLAASQHLYVFPVVKHIPFTNIPMGYNRHSVSVQASVGDTVHYCNVMVGRVDTLNGRVMRDEDHSAVYQRTREVLAEVEAMARERGYQVVEALIATPCDLTFLEGRLRDQESVRSSHLDKAGDT